MLGDPHSNLDPIVHLDRLHHGLDVASSSDEDAATRFRILSECGSDLVLELEANGRIAWVSPNFDSSSVRSAIGGHSFFDLLHPDDLVQVKELFVAALRDQEVARARFRDIRREDGRGWQEATITPYRKPRRGLRALLVIRDVTESVESLERLRESEACHRILAESASEGMIIHARGEVLFANAAAARIVGAENSDDLIGDRVEELVDPACFGRVGERLERLRREGRLPEEEWQLVRRDGEVRDMAGTASIASHGDRRVILSLLRDVTEAKQLERSRAQLELQLRQSQKLESLGMLAGGVAHDFNNLLMIVLGNTRIATSMLDSEPKVREILAEVLEAADGAALLTQQLLAYAGRRVPQVEIVDLSEHVRSIAGLMTSGSSRNVHLRLDLAESLPGVEADPAQLHQLVMNLVLNAADSLGRSGGSIRVSTRVAFLDARSSSEWIGAKRRPGVEYVMLEVEDTGRGMDDETRGRIFEPFFTTREEGHGLGLSAVLGAVKEHAGGMLVRSAPGEGATFSVYLPAICERASRSIGVPAVVDHPGEGRILVVDDEPAMRRILRRILEVSGYCVSEAADGVEALEAVSKDEPDLVVLDLSMPRLGGEEVLRRLASECPGLPVLLSSGYAHADVAKRVALGPGAAFLPKPYAMEQLLEAVGALMPR